jgi:hypothetical protein
VQLGKEHLLENKMGALKLDSRYFRPTELDLVVAKPKTNPARLNAENLLHKLLRNLVREIAWGVEAMRRDN